MGKIIENFWDCQYCNSINILGRYRECPNCGRPRGDNTRFNMRDPKNYVDEETAKNISRNPDWYCEFCNSLNGDKDDTCKSCGASRYESKRTYFDMVKAEENKEKEEGSRCGRDKINSSSIISVSDKEEKLIKEDAVTSYFTNNHSKYNIKRNAENKIKNFINKISLKKALAVAGGSLLTIFLLGVLIYAITPKKDVLNVIEIGWDRSISIEELKTVNESDWRLPPGARLHYTQEEIYDYEKVIDHYDIVTEEKTRTVIDYYDDITSYTDLGNGYSEEITTQVPVYKTETYTEPHEEPVYRLDPIYKTKYYYEIDKWVYGRSVKTSGLDKNPYWGDVVLDDKERRGGSTESYYIIATNSKGKSEKYYLSYSDWANINQGDTLNVIVYIFNRIKIVDEDGNLITNTE